MRKRRRFRRVSLFDNNSSILRGSRTGFARSSIARSKATGETSEFLLSLYSEGENRLPLSFSSFFQVRSPPCSYCMLQKLLRIPHNLPITRSFSYSSSQMSPTSPPSTLSLATSFILSQVSHHRNSKEKDRAMVIGIQGPQGSGSVPFLPLPSPFAQNSPSIE